MSNAPAAASRRQTGSEESTPAMPPPPAPAGQPAAGQPAAGPGGAQGSGAQQPQMLSELKVSGHVMTLDTGLYCILHKPALGVEPAGGLPGIRVSLPPEGATRPDALSIASFRPDGWLSLLGDAALVRVHHGPARLLVTIYQAMGASERTAPNIQVMKLLEAGAEPARAATPEPARADPAAARAVAARGAAIMEMVAHIQERGDVGAMFGEWLGERGSQRWIEGFGLSPTHEIPAKDVEYQAVLGQGWLSPWVEGGQFCGSRAMALPLLGLRVRLRGEAAETHDVIYSATFIDGGTVGPVSNGEPCEADSLAALEAFQIMVRRREPEQAGSEDAAAAQKRARKAGRAEPADPVPEPAKGKPSGRKR